MCTRMLVQELQEVFKTDAKILIKCLYSACIYSYYITLPLKIRHSSTACVNGKVSVGSDNHMMESVAILTHKF